jgi:hypothetical protein
MDEAQPSPEAAFDGATKDQDVTKNTLRPRHHEVLPGRTDHTSYIQQIKPFVGNRDTPTAKITRATPLIPPTHPTHSSFRSSPKVGGFAEMIVESRATGRSWDEMNVSWTTSTKNAPKTLKYTPHKHTDQAKDSKGRVGTSEPECEVSDSEPDEEDVDTEGILVKNEHKDSTTKDTTLGISVQANSVPTGNLVTLDFFPSIVLMPAECMEHSFKHAVSPTTEQPQSRR